MADTVLPKGWKIVEYPGSFELEDEFHRVKVGMGRPYNPTPMSDITKHLLKEAGIP